MNGNEMLLIVGGVVLTVLVSIGFGIVQGVDIGVKRGAECILAGHKVTEDYQCIDIDKLRGKQ